MTFFAISILIVYQKSNEGDDRLIIIITFVVVCLMELMETSFGLVARLFQTQ